MKSRTVLSIIVVALLLIVCVGLYFLFFGGKSTTVTSGQNGQTGSLPNAGTQNNPATAASSTTSSSGLAKNFGIISNNPTLDYFIDPSNVVTAVEPDGEVIQVANGQVSSISSLVMQNVLSASFSADGEKILISFGDPSNPQTSVFDVVKKIWTPLPAGLHSPVWSPVPSDYRVAYYTTPTQGVEAFATIDASKTNPTPVSLLTLHVQDTDIAWPAKNQVVLSPKPSAYVASSAWSYNLTTGTLTPIAIETPGLAMMWGGGVSSTAPTGLVFSSGAYSLGGSLALANLSGSLIQQLKLVTLPSKCAFAAQTSTVATASSTTITTSTPYLFCGVPRDQDTLSTSHLPDDYNQMVLFTSDDIYRINLQSGAIDTVFNDETQNLDVSDVKFFNNTLLFVNRYDQKLYGIQL